MAGEQQLERGTARRAAILSFIVHYAQEHGFPPSLREITTGVGLSSVNATREHLAKLEADGVLSMRRGGHRAITVKVSNG